MNRPRVLPPIVALAAAVSPSGAVEVRGAPTTRSVGADHADIYVVAPHGGHKLRLTDAEMDVYYGWPAWSPDGHKIAFSGSVCDDCRDGIFVVPSTGGRAERLRIGERAATHPTWNSTATRIAFAGGDGALYVLDVSTRRVKRLTGNGRAHDQPAWSPNGRRIVFTLQQQNGHWDIWSMTSDASHLRRLTRSKETEAEPSWSPDGRSIAFTRQLAGRWSLWVMRADGSGQRKITNGLLSDEAPSWSPDGRNLAFSRVALSAVYVVDLCTERIRRLRTGIPNSSNPAWSPGGGAIAFVGQLGH